MCHRKCIGIKIVGSISAWAILLTLCDIFLDTNLLTYSEILAKHPKHMSYEASDQILM